jgi:hypothetical protein
MLEWTSIRQDEDDRIRNLAKLVQPALHRWDANGPYSKRDADYVHEQVARVVSILNESSELGKRNNDKFAKCTEQLSAIRSDRSESKMTALLTFQDECARVLIDELPQRSKILDHYEREVHTLVDFINDRLSQEREVRVKE